MFVLRVLLVDDDDTYWELVQVALARSALGERVQVTRLCDGSEVLPHLMDRAQGPLPNLILLDQRMAVTDGVEALKQIRSHHHLCAIPSCIVSSSDLPTEVRSGYEAGASVWAKKPMEFHALSAWIHQLLEFWLDLAELPGRARWSASGGPS